MLEAFPVMTSTHIGMGTIGLMSGAVAMLFRKGSRGHRQAGNVFFVSMLLMAATGAWLAYLEPDLLSVVAGSLTFYLVATAWAVVMRKPATCGRFEWIAMLAASGIAVAAFGGGIEAVSSIEGRKDGSSAPPYFIFGTVALIAALLDANMIRRGGVSGAARLARHLWRMLFALLLATAALFLGQPQVFPEAMRSIGILVLPVFTVMAAMIFWLVSVHVSPRRPRPVAAGDT